MQLQNSEMSPTVNRLKIIINRLNFEHLRKSANIVDKVKRDSDTTRICSVVVNHPLYKGKYLVRLIMEYIVESPKSGKSLKLSLERQ